MDRPLDLGLKAVVRLNLITVFSPKLRGLLLGGRVGYSVPFQGALHRLSTGIVLDPTLLAKAVWLRETKIHYGLLVFRLSMLHNNKQAKPCSRP